MRFFNAMAGNTMVTTFSAPIQLNAQLVDDLPGGRDATQYQGLLELGVSLDFLIYTIYAHYENYTTYLVSHIQIRDNKIYLSLLFL